MLKEFEKETIKDRYTGWELIELLDIPIDQILEAALDNDWINEDNVDDVLFLAGLRR